MLWTVPVTNSGEASGSPTIGLSKKPTTPTTTRITPMSAA